jgi:hypothetical protein
LNEAASRPTSSRDLVELSGEPGEGVREDGVEVDDALEGGVRFARHHPDEGELSFDRARHPVDVGAQLVDVLAPAGIVIGDPGLQQLDEDAHARQRLSQLVRDERGEASQILLEVLAAVRAAR